jgi:hypothetical protein
MHDGATLIVYRGPEVSLRSVSMIVMELLGGHLRPDASLAVHGSAPVRVDAHAATRSHDPLAGTVRAIHLAVDADDGILTDLSELAMRHKLGFPERCSEQGWAEFGHIPSDAVALRLSEHTGPVATLSLATRGQPMGAYSVFSTGRRIWSACYRPGLRYCTWDGAEISVQAADARADLPPEGEVVAFPAHGLQLLFPEPLDLGAAERRSLLPGLLLACRPPSAEARGDLLVRGGRFQEPTPLDEDDWLRFQHSFSR